MKYGHDIALPLPPSFLFASARCLAALPGGTTLFVILQLFNHVKLISNFKHNKLGCLQENTSVTLRFCEFHPVPDRRGAKTRDRIVPYFIIITCTTATGKERARGRVCVVRRKEKHTPGSVLKSASILFITLP